MAVQSTLRLASELSTVTGTKVRDVRPEDVFFLMRQVNVVGALIGGEHVGNDGKSLVRRPKILKTKKIDDFRTELFTNQEITQSFEVTTGATASGTTIVVSDTNSEVYAKSWMQVAETGDVVYVSANSSGSLTVERQTGSQAVSVGQHLIQMGQLSGESSSNPAFLIRDEDNHFNFTAELHKAWRVSNRESNVKRYTGKSWDNLKKQKLIEIMRDMENLVILSKRINTVDSSGIAATTPRGLESWATDGNGTTFDFGGTVELSDVRELGDQTSDWSSNKKICLTSQKVISAIMSSLDSKLRLEPSDLKEKAGLMQAKAFSIGADTIEFVPCNTYQNAGKEGQGIIFDPSRIELRFLQDITMYQAGPEDDSTLTSDMRGDWYMDHGAIMPLDGGQSIVRFSGANAVAS